MSLHLPIHTNAFKLLLEMCMFFVITSILLMFDFCFQQKLLENKNKNNSCCISWLLPGFFGTVPQIYLRGYIPGDTVLSNAPK